MEKLLVTIQIPEHLHAEDGLSNVLQDAGIFADLATDIQNAVRAFVGCIMLDVQYRDVEVRVEEFDKVFPITHPRRTGNTPDGTKWGRAR